HGMSCRVSEPARSAARWVVSQAVRAAGLSAAKRAAAAVIAWSNGHTPEGVSWACLSRETARARCAGGAGSGATWGGADKDSAMGAAIHPSGAAGQLAPLVVNGPSGGA